MIRRMPIGTQNFEKLRENNDLYVDKTLYIEKLQLLGNVFFLSRPHRFGKSLFLSTLRAYFEGKKELFAGLYIEQVEEKLALQQRRDPWTQYPVLYFDLNAKNYVDTSTLKNRLAQQLLDFECKYGIEKVSEDVDDRFIYLIKALYEKTGQQVVVLVDEYDKPLLETVYNDDLNAANRSLLKAFYEVLKQCDAYIRFAFLTGITKFSKLTLFSGLNNLMDITLVDDYSAICGFTEQELSEYFTPEIEALATAHKKTIEQTRATLKKTYDGYCFSRRGENVYNPFSLLKVLAIKEYDYYWFATATPEYIIRYLERNAYFVPNLDGEVEIDINDVQDFRFDSRSSVPLLFQAGYLTIKQFLPRFNLYRLGYPNEEVRNGFLKNLLPTYTDIEYPEVGKTISDAYRAVLEGNIEGVMQIVESLLAGILYNNLPADHRGKPLREQYYQTVLYLFFRLLGLHTQSEVVVATGRVDMVVRTTKHLYLFEFKVTASGSAQDAIDQIKTRGYAKKFRSTKRKIHYIGVSFDEKTRNVGEWKEEVE